MSPEKQDLKRLQGRPARSLFCGLLEKYDLLDKKGTRGVPFSCAEATFYLFGVPEVAACVTSSIRVPPSR
jgi:hypothetical protein